MDYNYSQFMYLKEGYLYIEGMKMKTLQEELTEKFPTNSSPIFVYSKSQILQNVNDYTLAMKNKLSGCKTLLGYAVKANYNYTLLKMLRELNCIAICVSGNEVKMAAAAGFDPKTIILNGNGKTNQDLREAITMGAMINIDSTFDLENIVRCCQTIKTKCRVLIRVNPNIDPCVHPYVATGVHGTKFGVHLEQLNSLLEQLQSAQEQVELVGLHCHLGSTIDDVSIFKEMVDFLLTLCTDIRAKGFQHLSYINIGGGLAIDYTKHAHRTSETNKHSKKPMPSPEDLVESIRASVSGLDMTMIVEPGRSIVGNAGILMTTVLGVKKAAHDTKQFIVVDGSMCEVIRPCLHDAYHHIELTEPTQAPGDRQMFDVVGPVCESADFLGKGRLLPMAHSGFGLAVFDTGPCCSSMGSNYNMRCRPAEILVDGDHWKIIRTPESFEDLLRPYMGL